jgi:GNAT superfamily N-acetyltransferase
VSRVQVRELGAGDAEVLDVVFAGLSARSRYLRFHSPVSRLTPSARRSLTAFDGRAHVAFGAFADGRPIGIVRIVVLGPGRAELAVEVVDAWHGRGVGTRLVRAARDRAVELGYRELVAEVLAENFAMLTVMRQVFPIVRTSRVGSELTIVLPIEDDELGLADLIDSLVA